MVRERSERPAAARAHPEPAPGFEAAVLDQVDAGVVATDLAGTIIHWNRGAEALYGWPALEAVGRHLLEVTVPPEERDEAERIVTSVLDGFRFEGELLVQRRDGHCDGLRERPGLRRR